jgi:signal transduction histidine kinase
MTGVFDTSRSAKEGAGYGLGLWTAKGIVERHGGSIQVNYEDGYSSAGTVFNVLLPINANSEPLVSAT